MNIKLTKKEDSEAGKVYLHIMFMGGDADTEHPEYFLLENINYIGDKDSIDLNEEHIKLINNFKILRDVLDINNRSYTDDYNDVLEKYGEEIADLYDNVPNDPQNDFQNKCYFSYLEIIAYDKEGNKYQGYIK